MIRSKHVLWVLAFGLVVPFAALAQQTPQSTTPPATTPPAAAPAAHEKHHATKAHAAPKINLNTATKEELMTLPGLTDETADKVIAARPFKSKSQLVEKNIVTKEEFKKLSMMITTGKMAHTKAASLNKK
ncbi:MAG: helix-hairpin-helix domain-containing protein [Candidatus Eisenbacteria bacterium]|uniref:Helix-hairpin-helix domain-containing protein n=1 Tax=Eiseniibacteriota bacterium TaxID=2212470 RepID=A0A538TGZ0_UNCEI|nr:MAG: helix-hairpin-helix domain-containing protein [Candidatus Eisenbacteria bacterium]